jgi:hypothetical protein
MAFNLVWKVEFGDIGGLHDITSLVFFASIDMNANMGSAGRTSCQITLNNNSGQFTPGGTGTYGSVDWFKQAIVISCTGGGITEYAFVGLLQDFTIDQTSIKQSTVSISGLDILTVCGRTSNQLQQSDVSENWIADLINSFTPSLSAGYAVTPFMGSTTSKRSQFNLVCATNQITAIYIYGLLKGTVGDWLNNNLLPTGPATVFMTDYQITSDRWIWNGYVIDSPLNRTTNAYTSNFVGDGTSLTSGQLPISQIDVGFTLDTLTNSCYAYGTQTNLTIQPVTVDNTTSEDKYGVRARTYSSCAPAVSFGGGITNNQFMNTVANFWANRYGEVRYIPNRVITTYSALRSSSVDDGVAMQAFVRLLSAKTAIWNRQTIKYKGAGMASSQTTQTVTTGRKIMITPSDTRIELTVVSGIDNQSFELNSSTYGILDTNRLG